MHLHTRNVNTAFRELVSFFRDGETNKTETFFRGINPIVRRPYKNPNGEGYTLTIDEPVLITYSHPRERVLFNRARDANPFFHLYEALWMLAGRNDVAPLAYYSSKIKDFSDDGKTFNGAYGYRWRHARTVSGVMEIYVDERWGGGITGPGHQVVRTGLDITDQLKILVAHLKSNPDSRRAVLSMWNVEDDLLKLGSKDVCCNLNVKFLFRTVEENPVTLYDQNNPSYRGRMATLKRYLDITVDNRSNDLVWGCLGCNYVQFSVLQEYMAAHLGVEVGQYHQISNNLHVYDWNWKPDEWLEDGKYDNHPPNQGIPYLKDYQNTVYCYGGKLFPLVYDPQQFDKELPDFVGAFNGEEEPWDCVPKYEEPFFEKVAGPMLTAFRCYKQKNMAHALLRAETIAADDWRISCVEWLKRRVK